MAYLQVKPGEEIDLKPLYDAADKPVDKVVIEFRPEDNSEKITLDEVAKLKVCAHPSKSMLVDQYSTVSI